MRRRDFIAVLTGGAAIWPLAVRAQPSRLPTIAWLGNYASAQPAAGWKAAFLERLQDLGWIDGRTATIEYRWIEDRPDRVAEFAAEFVRQTVDVIVTYGSLVPRLKQATSTIPIVFAVATDPVGNGFVGSLNRPGGNVTGMSTQDAETASKRLAVLRQAVPTLRRVAVLFDADYPSTVKESDDVRAAARALDLEFVPLEIRHVHDVAPAFATLGGKADALYIVIDSLVNASRTGILTLAAAARLPSIASAREYVQAGALLSYGPDQADLYRRAAGIVDRILRGTKVGDIPVEQPTKFELAVNLTTAKALGLTLPASFLSLADELVE